MFDNGFYPLVNVGRYLIWDICFFSCLEFWWHAYRYIDQIEMWYLKWTNALKSRERWTNQLRLGRSKGSFIYIKIGKYQQTINAKSFQWLLRDVMSGKINCVVVNDLSCFTRNYSDVWSLLDDLLGQTGVRFISLIKGAGAEQSE